MKWRELGKPYVLLNLIYKNFAKKLQYFNFCTNMLTYLYRGFNYYHAVYVLVNEEY